MASNPTPTTHSPNSNNNNNSQVELGNDIYVNCFQNAVWGVLFFVFTFINVDYEKTECFMLRSWAIIVFVYNCAMLLASLIYIIVFKVKQENMSRRLKIFFHYFGESFKFTQMMMELVLTTAILIVLIQQEECGHLRKLCQFYVIIEYLLLILIICFQCINGCFENVPEGNSNDIEDQRPLMNQGQNNQHYSSGSPQRFTDLQRDQ